MPESATEERVMGFTEVYGARVPIRMWTAPDDVEPDAMAQLRNIANLPWVQGVGSSVARRGGRGKSKVAKKVEEVVEEAAENLTRRGRGGGRRRGGQDANTPGRRGRDQNGQNQPGQG